MRKITILGLGVMGTALARTLLKNNFNVTVWNRSAGKAEMLEEQGAKVASSCDEAVAASPTIIVCIKTHADTRKLLGRCNLSKAKILLN